MRVPACATCVAVVWATDVGPPVEARLWTSAPDEPATATLPLPRRRRLHAREAVPSWLGWASRSSTFTGAPPESSLPQLTLKKPGGGRAAASSAHPDRSNRDGDDSDSEGEGEDEDKEQSGIILDTDLDGIIRRAQRNKILVKSAKKRPWYAALVLGWIVMICLVIGQCIILNQQYSQAWNTLLTYHEDAPWSFASYIKYRFGYWFTWNQSAYTVVVVQMFLSFTLLATTLYCVFCNTRAPDAAFKVLVWLVSPDGGLTETKHEGMVIGGLVSLGGLMIFAFVISVVHAAFSEYLAALRCGKPPVVEGGHILILGWTDETIDLLREVSIAARNQGGKRIVILAEQAKIEVEAAIRDVTSDAFNEIIVRSGSSYSVQDLERVTAATADLIVVMPNNRVEQEQRDAITLRTMLLLRHQGWPVEGELLVACSLVQNVPLMMEVGGQATSIVMLNSFVAKLLTQCSRGWGLGMAVADLIGFQGNSLWVEKLPKHLYGESFSDASGYYPLAVPIGVVAADESSANESLSKKLSRMPSASCPGFKPEARPDGLLEDPTGYIDSDLSKRHRIHLCPPAGTILGHGDSLIFIAKRWQDTMARKVPAGVGSATHPVNVTDIEAPGAESGVDTGVEKVPDTSTDSRKGASNSFERKSTVTFVEGSEQASTRQVIIFLGWNEWTGLMLLELDRFAPPESQVIIFAPEEAEPRNEKILRVQRNWDTTLQNLEVRNVQGHLGSYWELEERLATPLDEGQPSPLEQATRIFVLSGQHIQAQEADAFSVTTTLHVQDILNKHGFNNKVPIVPQICDRRTDPVCQGAGICDYVSTSNLMAKVLAVHAMDKKATILVNLLVSAEEPYFAVRYLEDYLPSGEVPTHISFSEAYHTVARHGDVLLGWTEDETSCTRTSGHVTFNPSDKHLPRRWQSTQHRLVVIMRYAEDAHILGSWAPKRHDVTREMSYVSAQARLKLSKSQVNVDQQSYLDVAERLRQSRQNTVSALSSPRSVKTSPRTPPQQEGGRPEAESRGAHAERAR